MANNKIRLILTVLLILAISISPLESIFLPHIAQAGSSGFGSNIGLVAWTNVEGSIDLTQASKLFTTIYRQDANTIEGTYSIYIDNYNTENINLYIDSNGLIATYYAGYEPASKTILWNSDKIFFSKLASIVTIGQSLGYTIDIKNIKYYDYRYPDANRYLIATQSLGENLIGNYDHGSFQFNVPNYATIYEASYSIYLNDIYNTQPSSTIAIDGNIIGSITGNGVIYSSYNSYIPTDVDHIFGVMSYQDAQSAVAMVIIYKDDNDNSQSKDTILVNNADYYFGDILAPPLQIQTAPSYTPTYTVPPVQTPRETVTMPFSIPTIQVTERSPEQTIPETTPRQTQDAPRKPPKVSVDLHGERTNIELGQESLLKGSIVSFNTNRETMHAQVIIIPPSGVSVVAADFVKSPAGQYTSDFELDPGKGKDIEVTIIPNEVGEFKVVSKITYYFGDDKDDNGYEEVKLDIKAKPKGGSDSTSGNVGQTTRPDYIPKDEPGFEIIFGIGMLIISYLYIRKK